MICSHFAPDNSIAAVRITKFAKCFYKNGYEVTVIAEAGAVLLEDEILKKDAQGIKVIRVENTKKAKKVIEKYKKIVRPFKEEKFQKLDNRLRINPKTGNKEFYTFETYYPFLGSIDYVMELYRQYDLFIQAKRYMNEILDVELIFTSYGGFISIFAGLYYKRKNKNIPWIFDIRDAVYNYKFTPPYVSWISKLYERYIWKRADGITAVSKGICKRVSSRYRNKVYCITNGYDRKDRNGITYSSIKNEKMKFTYTGAMYGGIRNLSPLFCNIRKLIEKKLIDENDIEFCFAGKESAYDIFWSQARKYCLECNCIYYGKLERKDSLKLQMESDILLVSSFDYQANEGGVITGKALEYMSANKPIIAVINGDIEHSELAEIIRKANLGCVYEEAHDEKDSQNLYYYLWEKYKEYKSDGCIKHNPNQEILRRFDYRYLGKKMLWVVDKVCERR